MVGPRGAALLAVIRETPEGLPEVCELLQKQDEEPDKVSLLQFVEEQEERGFREDRAEERQRAEAKGGEDAELQLRRF